VDEDDKVKQNRINNIKDNEYKIKRIKLSKYIKTDLKVTFPIYKHEAADKTILIFFDSISRQEKIEGEFLSPGLTGGIFTNVLAYLETQEKIANFVCIPYTNQKHASFWVKKFKPDHILFSGFKLSEPYMNKQLAEVIARIPGAFRGRIFDYKKYKISSTFSWKYLSDFEFKSLASTSNLLSFFMGDIANAIYGKNRYTLPTHKEIVAKLITTMSQWKEFFAQLIRQKIISIDTETENLNRVFNNKLLTIQFCFDGKTGWTIPIYHPETPFTAPEIKLILKDLAEWLEFGESRFLIYHNAKFDIIQLRRDLKINFVNHNLYDTATGEYCLGPGGENRKFFSNAKACTQKQTYALEHLSFNYGGLAYLYGDIHKDDRAHMAEIPLEKISIYGAADVVYPFWIAEFQIREAKRLGDRYKKFKKVVTQLCSDMTHVFIEMEMNGALIDGTYIRSLLAPNSDLQTLMRSIEQKLYESSACKKANKLLETKFGKGYKQDMFGRKIQSPWRFDVTKQDHMQKLFFDVLQLRPLKVGKNGLPSTDKAFINEYSNSVKEVGLYGELRQTKAISNNFIKGFNKYLMEKDDCKDSRIRSRYGFLSIVSLRSSSFDPNLQNVPSRGKLAKYIKREFIAPLGRILIKVDYNANEIRGWGNVSGDKNIATAFQPGIELRRELRLLFNKDPELQAAVIQKMQDCKWSEITEAAEKQEIIKKSNLGTVLQLIFDIESKGDIHKVNYQNFFGVPAYKVTKLQRQSVKEVAFGTLYGKGPTSTARVIFAKELKSLEKKYGIDSDKYHEREQEYVQQAKDIMAKMFKRFSKGKEWIEKQNSIGQDLLTNVSDFGAVRHLSGYLHSDNRVIGMMNRRGPNSLIQGPSSNTGYIGARQLQIVNHQLLQNKVDLGWRHSNFVHDSVDGESFIDMSPITMYYIEHALTTLAYRKCRDVFDWDLPIQFEIEMELGAALSRTQVWDFTQRNLRETLYKEIEWQQEELQYKLPKKALIAAAMHNFGEVWRYKERELRQMEGYKSSDVMLMTPEIAGKIKWKRIEIQ
jgi:DNA polymerase I-like protein with 3'-5' exonuclease and polymerase domains